MTQGKIERWHQTLKNRILLENYYLPGDPKILDNVEAEDQIRLWVPACATGEEVYSVAILLK